MKRPISAAAACCLPLVAPALVVLGAAPAAAAGSIPLTAIGTAYTQTFDTLASSGTSSVVPDGWSFAETGTNANGLYTAGTGSSNSGDSYGFGATGSTERALGSVQSGSLVSRYGVSFTNDTGQVVTSLDVTLTGEQWRLGALRTSAPLNDRLEAEVSTDASDLSTGTWTAADGLDVAGPVTTGTVGALDGNAATNRTAVSGSVTGLAVQPGQTVWLRWADANAGGADDGLALDDVSVTPRSGEVEEPPPAPVCGDPATGIHDVQGAGAVTPLDGRVQVEGVVVGDFQTGGLNGFFVQEEDADADADPRTSEGVFVFAPGSAAVAVGDVVRLTGTPSEFGGSTQLGDVADLQVCATDGLDEVSVTELALPSGDLARESLEGMRVSSPQRLTVTEVYGLGRYGEVVLASGGRLWTPTAVVEPGAEAEALQASNDRRRIVLDDGSTRQNPDPTLYPQGGLSATNTLRVGDATDDLAGVLDERFGAYRVQPVGTPAQFESGNPRPAAPEEVGGDVRVASFNVLNYFNGQPEGTFTDPRNRGANDQAELDRQTAKEVAAITALDADVVGLMELENDASGTADRSAIEALVDALNADGSAGTYDFVDTGVVGTDAIRVGLLFRPEHVRPVGDHAVLDSTVDARFDDTRNRPSVAQTFAKTGSGPEGDRFTVVVNHLKSKGSECDGDPDLGDGAGNCNATRTAAAEALGDWIASDPTGSGDPDTLVIGDLNAYAQEDPVDALREAGLVDQVAAFVGQRAWSYVFEGQAGYLDHALSTPGLEVTGVTEWHVNADEPVVLDYNTEFKSSRQQSSYFAPDAYRSSDHDPVLVGLELEDAPVVDAGGPYRVKVNRSVTLTATGSDADGDDLTYAWDLDGDGTFESVGRQVTFQARGRKLGEHVVAVRVSDGDDTATDTTTVRVAPR